MDILGRNIELLLPEAERAVRLGAFSRYLTKGDGPLAHRDEELRADDVELAEEERPRLVLVAVRELEAVRPVYGHRVDAQALERLQDRLARAAVERDALLHLRRLRRPLEQEDVRERVPRAEHRHARSARRAGDLVAELVDLENGLLQVFFVDLVGGNGTHGGSLQVLG